MEKCLKDAIEKCELMAMDNRAQTKIEEKFWNYMLKHQAGFDFTICSSRSKWFSEFLKANKLAYERIADSYAYLSKKVIRQNTSLREFFIRMFKTKKLWVIRGVGAKDLVAEDFCSHHTIQTVCFSIAPTQELLKIRESGR